MACNIPNQGSGNTVIVLNQPFQYQRVAYLRRGTTFKGHHFGYYSLYCIIVIGAIITQLAIYLSILSNLSFLLLPVGIFFIGFFFFLVTRAKREFEDLPLAHPDRLKYLGISVAQVPSTSVPPSNQAAAPPQGPLHPEAKKYETREPSYPHSPSHSGQGLSAPPPGTFTPQPPPSYDQYPPAQGYTPSQGEPNYPHSPSHCGQGPSAPPPGTYTPTPPPSYDQYPPSQGYTPLQGPTPPGYHPLPGKDDEDPPPYSAE